MVLDRLENLEHYASLHPRFPAAFDYLRRLLAAGTPDGKYVLEGTDTPEEIFVCLCTVENKTDRTAIAESHMKYIDVQVVLSGADTLYTPTGIPALTEESAERDCRLYAPVPLDSCTRICVEAGHFAIYFVDELHAPCHGDTVGGMARKAILKVLA